MLDVVLHLRSPGQTGRRAICKGALDLRIVRIVQFSAFLTVNCPWTLITSTNIGGSRMGGNVEQPRLIKPGNLEDPARIIILCIETVETAHIDQTFRGVPCLSIESMVAATKSSASSNVEALYRGLSWVFDEVRLREE